MAAFDVIVLFMFGTGAVMGGLRGFVQESLSLIAWVMAVIAVRVGHGATADLLTPMIGTRTGAAAGAFLLLFAGTFMLGRLLARSLGARTRQSLLGPFDRALGFGFGFLKALLAASLMFLVLAFAVDLFEGGPRQRPAWLRDARTYPLLNATSRAMVDYLHRQRDGAEAGGGGTDDAAADGPDGGAGTVRR